MDVCDKILSASLCIWKISLKIGKKSFPIRISKILTYVLNSILFTASIFTFHFLNQLLLITVYNEGRGSKCVVCSTEGHFFCYHFLKTGHGRSMYTMENGKGYNSCWNPKRKEEILRITDGSPWGETRDRIQNKGIKIHLRQEGWP